MSATNTGDFHWLASAKIEIYYAVRKKPLKMYNAAQNHVVFDSVMVYFEPIKYMKVNISVSHIFHPLFCFFSVKCELQIFDAAVFCKVIFLHQDFATFQECRKCLLYSFWEIFCIFPEPPVFRIRIQLSYNFIFAWHLKGSTILASGSRMLMNLMRNAREKCCS